MASAASGSGAGRGGAAQRGLFGAIAIMRITRIDTLAAPAELQGLYQAMYEQRGNVPNMFRTAAHRPELLRTMVAHFRCVMEQGSVPAKLKELLAVRVSQINDCDY